MRLSRMYISSDCFCYFRGKRVDDIVIVSTILDAVTLTLILLKHLDKIVWVKWVNQRRKLISGIFLPKMLLPNILFLYSLSLFIPNKI